MITINKILELSGGTPPYKYNWIGSDSCNITFEPESGTTNSIVNTNIVFDTEDCIENSNIRLYAEDSKGCKNIYPVDFVNPCVDFNIRDINLSRSGNSITLTVVIPVEASIEWVFDDLVFRQISSSDNSITLEIINANASENTMIYVNATSIDGCTTSQQYIYNFCSPISSNLSTSVCDNVCITSLLCLNVEICESPIDWSTLEVILPNPNFNYEHDGKGCIRIDCPNTEEGVYRVLYRVADMLGNYSNQSIIVVNVTACSNSRSCLAGSPIVYDFTCEELNNIGSLITIADLSSTIVTNGCSVDFNTFEFIEGVSQTLTSRTTLDTQYGTLSLSGSTIVYRLNSNPQSSELIRYKVSSDNGDSTGVLNLNINYECVEAPITNDDTYCITCEAPFDILDILSNDTGDINPSTILITSFPPSTEGTVSIDSNNNVRFIPNSNFEGVSSFSYRVSDYNGNFSNISTVSVEVICAGQDTTVDVCNT